MIKIDVEWFFAYRFGIYIEPNTLSKSQKMIFDTEFNHIQKYSTWYNQSSNDLERWMHWCHSFAGIFPVKMKFDGSLQEMKIICLVHPRLQMLYPLGWLVIVKANNSEANSKIHFIGFDLDSTLHFEISPATQPINIHY